MSFSDHIQVPVEQLQTLASQLTSMRTELDSVEQGVAPIMGVDDVHGHRMREAVSEFFQEWEASRRTLIDNVGVLGDVSGAIAQMVGDFDTQGAQGFNDFAAALREGGQG
ncbi:MAG: hypothetical protein Q4G50_07375 [Corynebacterium sp.]|uniref:hypothetical protein n=1 Tax=Corynebacterium sp. TaxID=1720 RepID=UPI0026DEDB0E|nr:hypothetical protein [Corynebacterium sp.]MDO5669808.1 hypothetical protein [Corynebacterium sp.]